MQLYEVVVRNMSVCDEADVVVSWSAVIAEEDLAKLTLTTVAELLALQIKDAPLTNVRPMTETEVADWREEGSS